MPGRIKLRLPEGVRILPERYYGEHNEDVAQSAYPVPGTDPNEPSARPVYDGPDDTGGNPPYDLPTLDAADMHSQVLKAIGGGFERMTRELTYAGATIIRLDGAAAIVNPGQASTSHMRLRLRAILFSRATAGATILTVGTAQYPFTLPAAPVVVSPFPLVIERGSDMTISGDGVAYLICDPE